MKKILPLAVIALMSTNTWAQNKKLDIETIKSMCGCYEVSFASTETFNYPKDKANYKPSEVKLDRALEWITPIEITDNKISLQHLLVITDHMIIKHWRQDWTFENQDIWHYSGFNGVDYYPKSKEQVKGQWAQQVFEVDDTPRYMESATWIYADGRKFWQNTADAPLPRREYSKRSDYNILQRNNTHEITKQGWIHDQDNAKIIRTKGEKDYVLAYEKGLNTYTKVDDSRCEAAQKYWKENEKLWEKVRSKWNVELAKKKDLRFKPTVDDKPLYSYLFELPANSTQEQVDEIIEKFIIR